MIVRWTEIFSLNLWSNKIKMRTLAGLLSYQKVHRFIVQYLGVSQNNTSTKLWWFYCHVDCTQSSCCDVTWCYRPWKVFFRSGRGHYKQKWVFIWFVSSGSWQLQQYSFCFGKYSHLLSFFSHTYIFWLNLASDAFQEKK